MPRRVISKWRPPLALVLGGNLAAVFFLPLIGIAYFRVAGGVLGWAETSWMIGWMAFVATALLSALLWRLVLRPVQTMTNYVKQEGEAEPPTHFGTPEFSQLGAALLEMTSALRGREAVLRSYADHVTHELKSPLTVIQGAAELLDNPDLTETDRAKLLAGITNAVGRMEGLLDSQRAFAQAREPMPDGSCLLSDLVKSVEAAVIHSDGVIPLPRGVMDVVVVHLVGNALAHGATEVVFETSAKQLLISDNGLGISKGNRQHIFEPFFTTRRSDGGTGMGLPIVRRMLQAHDADIRLTENPGAEFEISFPEK